MVMRITPPGQPTAAASTEVPLEMLSACHGRVEMQCETLQRLCEHLQRHGADRAAIEAAEAVLRYFRLAAPHHHADEEEDLFPALLALPGQADGPLAALIGSLVQEHRMLEGLWQRLEAELVQVEAGDGTALSSRTVDAFVAAYAGHIEREESELLPAAARLLGGATLDGIGQAMRARRNIVV